MRLLDSNIIIYATKPGYEALQDLISAPDVCTSAVSYVEVLGYHALTQTQIQHLEEFFAYTPTFGITAPVLDEAVKLRRLMKLKLGDALIAGTALVHNHTLLTRNTKDFAGIAGLVVSDPLSDTKPAGT